MLGLIRTSPDIEPYKHYYIYSDSSYLKLSVFALQRSDEGWEPESIFIWNPKTRVRPKNHLSHEERMHKLSSVEEVDKLVMSKLKAYVDEEIALAEKRTEDYKNSLLKSLNAVRDSMK